MKPSIFSNWVFNRCLAAKGPALWQRILRGVRWRIGNASDPTVIFHFEGFQLLAPISHQLAFFRRDLPLYSKNIGTVAKLLKDHYPNLTMVDIGANIGDTAAIVNRQCPVPMLCVEGSPRFYDYLKANLSTMAVDAEPDLALVGNEINGPQRLVLKEGTARSELDVEAGVRAQSLSTILARHPRFMNFKLLKVDTDGFDCSILGGELPLLEKHHPVIFFEYDPQLFCGSPWDGLRLFFGLRQIGYDDVLFYANTGELLAGGSLADEDFLQDMHAWAASQASRRYCDVCVFAREDGEVAAQIRAVTRQEGH